MNKGLQPLNQGTGDSTKFLRGDGTWSVPSGLRATHATGQIYGAFPSTTTNTYTVPQGTLFARPFRVYATETAVSLGFEVLAGGSTGAVARVGIYSDTGSMYPGSLLLDAGTGSATTSNARVAIAISQSLTAGLYWLVLASQGAPSPTNPGFRFVNANSLQSEFVSVSSNSALSFGNLAYSMTGVTSTLPSTFTAAQAGTPDVPVLTIGF